MVPLFDLKSQYRSISAELRAAIDEVLENTTYILGPSVADFEKRFADYSGARYGIGVNSGTSALQLALLAAGIGPGDEVITTPLTFVATAAAIRYTGAVPVFVDVEPETLTIDVNRIEAAITPRTRAILPVHLYGHPADLDPILEIAQRHGLKVIEDCAQAHGALYKGRPVGGIGDFGCFSFYPSKNLGAFGEGGLVTTNDAAGDKKLRMMRDWGQEIKNRHDIEGFNMRLEGLQGAVLGVKLRYLENWNEKRREHALFYTRKLDGSGLKLPAEKSYAVPVYHLYVVRTEERDAFQEALVGQGIHTGAHYPIPVHLQQAHADLGYERGAFPVAEKAADTVLSLPMFPELTEEQRDSVVTAVYACVPEQAALAQGTTA